MQSIENVLEKRNFTRNPAQVFVRLQVINEPESESVIALATDINEAGITVLTYIPLPVGTRVKIKKDNFNAIGEVADWEWVYAIDMARMGVRLIEKEGQLPAQ